jgi:LacI family transcriptional regulator
MVKTAERPRQVALIVESQIAPRRRMLDGVARYMHEHEPWAVYLKPSSVEGSVYEWLDNWKGDGIIAAVRDDGIRAIAEIGMPVVDVVGVFRDQRVPLVHTNDRTVGRAGAEHLLERGFRHFGFVEYEDELYYWSAERRAGFAEMVETHGFHCDVVVVPWPSGRAGPQTWEQHQRKLVDWIGCLPRPVGVMTSTDLLGQQLLEACQRAQVIVPEQVAVIGADNDEEICRIAYPPLSSVVINDHQRGYEAAAMLDRMMRGEPAPADVIYVEPAGTVARASTDIMAIDDQTIVRALRFIRSHACDGINVDDVVHHVPLSRSVLERRFRRHVGRSINNEIVRIRLNRAIELLCETPLELKVIAQKAGFVSQSYMSSVFRQRLGRTPGSYRHAGRAAVR